MLNAQLKRTPSDPEPAMPVEPFTAHHLEL